MSKTKTQTITDEQKAILEKLGLETVHEMLQVMLTTRAFEEKAEELYMLGKTHGTMHLSIGQEASAIGASYAMRRQHDYLLNHHRGHGHILAWGSALNPMMAEFLGKEAGFCRGRGGSMHIADVERNNLGANGIVGGGLPIASGVGLSIKLRGTDQVCLVLFGDGAANEGAFHESLNLASIWDLPVIFYCENNQYAMSMAVERAFNIEHISDRACAYNIPGETVDGNDFFEVYQAVSRAATRARAGEGPTLIEAVTYRWKGHSRSDRQSYRTREEIKEWQQRDPIPRFSAILQAAGMLSEEQHAALRENASRAIEEALAFAEASPEPDVANIMDGLYA
ncbi:MAG: thiamine pyrophosphate-dependent dehydrogenase E1 component subunit alpha [Anaerolineales bacterium]|nr:MAG: thiamine pyrophosphate-dependent dehydrogenase E1 component subunit alpha [Anaerolineales bacterium]